MTKCTHRGEHSHLEEACSVPYFHILFVDPVSWAFTPVSSKAIFTASEQKEKTKPKANTLSGKLASQCAQNHRNTVCSRTRVPGFCPFAASS
jgi:hypothetical protein